MNPRDYTDFTEKEKAEDEVPFLVLGSSGKRPLHVIAEDDPVSGETIVVTAHELDRKVWKAGFKERRACANDLRYL